MQLNWKGEMARQLAHTMKSECRQRSTTAYRQLQPQTVSLTVLSGGSRQVDDACCAIESDWCSKISYPTPMDMAIAYNGIAV